MKEIKDKAQNEEVEETKELEPIGDFEVVNEDEDFEELEHDELEDDLGPQTIDILPEIDEVESIEDLDAQQEALEENPVHILQPMEEYDTESLKKSDVEVRPIDIDEIKKEVKADIIKEYKSSFKDLMIIGVALLAILGIVTSWGFTVVAAYLGYVYYKIEKDPILMYYSIGILIALSILRLTSIAYAVGRIVGS